MELKIIQTQTIIKDVKDMTHIDTESGDFVQTDFDNEIETFISGLVEEDKFPMSMNFLATDGKLMCVILYAEMSPQQKNAMSAQKSGLTLLKEKIITPS